MTKQDKILNFLSQGFKPAQIASIVGVTPAYISQLVKEPSFQEQYKSRLATIEAETDMEEEERLTNKYKAGEHVLLDSIIGQAPMMEHRDQIRALEVIAARQEKRAARLLAIKQGPQQAHQTYVQINLPAHALPEVRMNEDNEITQIGTRLMAPMSSEGVKNLFTQMSVDARINTIPELE